jgi:penicillin-binding protein 1C
MPIGPLYRSQIFRGQNWRRQVVRASVVFFTTGVCVLFVLACSIWIATPIHDWISTKNNHTPSDVMIVDRHNTPLESIRKINTVRKLNWTSWTDTSPAFQDLLIQSEDKRFFTHRGVDWLALGHGAFESIFGKSYRGASTITMQLSNMLTANPFQNPLLKKFRQVVVALKIENKWTKSEILDAYVNSVSFRGELVGIAAASKGLFNLKPSGLTNIEAAILAALLRSPNAKNELVAQRVCRILKSSDCTTIQQTALELLASTYLIPRERNVLPILNKNIVISESRNEIKTSIVAEIQKLALSALQEQLRSLRNQNVKDGAVLILDSRTGETIAYVANGGPDFSSAVHVDGLQSRRQAGSTLKPFLFATAMDLNYITETSLVEDSSTDISLGGGKIYRPKNYDHTFRGNVSVAEALASSMNVPAVRTLQVVGETRFLNKLHQLGFSHLEQDEFFGPSLALGAVDITLWDLTHAYRQFSTDDMSAISQNTKKTIFNILASPEYRRFTFGMDSVLALPFTAAVKTGTSKDMRDNWCVGWTKDFTIGVWVGNFNGEPMWSVSGVSGAAPIWRQLMLHLHTNTNTQNPDLVYKRRALPLPRSTLSHFRYPAPDMLVALDPDIPLSNQMVPIEINNPQPFDHIIHNQQKLGPARSVTMLPIKLGRHVIELRNNKNELVDSVSFVVR